MQPHVYKIIGEFLDEEIGEPRTRELKQAARAEKNFDMPDAEKRMAAVAQIEKTALAWQSRATPVEMHIADLMFGRIPGLIIDGSGAWVHVITRKWLVACVCSVCGVCRCGSRFDLYNFKVTRYCCETGLMDSVPKDYATQLLNLRKEWQLTAESPKSVVQSAVFAAYPDLASGGKEHEVRACMPRTRAYIVRTAMATEFVARNRAWSTSTRQLFATWPRRAWGRGRSTSRISTSS